MHLDEKRIDAIVEKVVSKLAGEQMAKPLGMKPVSSHASANASPSLVTGKYFSGPGQVGVFPDMDSAGEAAGRAQEQLVKLPLQMRIRVIEAMREVSRQHNRELAEMTVKETGIGRVADKINKNLLAINKTPGVEDLKPIAWSGDDGLTLVERAPYGVIGSITPCTNATETIICNAIGMIAGGNAVIFNVHPAAKNISNYYISLLNKAIVAVGGPPNLLCCIKEPTIQSAQALMSHPAIRLLVVTGGPAVVKVAMQSEKKVIAAGPGNPPAVVDETAHIERAAQNIIKGASLDNNIVCVVEKEFIAVSDIADMLKQYMLRYGAYEVTGRQLARLEKVVLKGDGVNKDWVGKNANRILDQIGISASDDLRLIFCETSEDHPFVQHELLMPVVPLIRVSHVDEGIAMAKRVEHNFRHTACIHSTNIEKLHKMAVVMDTSIFVKNAPSYAGLALGGEGYTSFTIASPTGEGLTSAKDFTRVRRCVLKDYFRIV